MNFRSEFAILGLLLAALATPLLPAFGAETAAAGGYRIERLEPPHWWLGFKDRRLQLLVHGPRIAELTPSISQRGVKIENTQRVQSPNYLFIDLLLGEAARPGAFEIQFAKNGETLLRHEFTLRQKNPSPEHARGFDTSDAIYLITPDRFANGDPANDNLPNGQDRVNRSEPYGRHGGDLEGVLQRLSYIRELGFTAIWLNPVLENRMPESSYHGYATTDFYNVDPRFGDNEKYAALARAARAQGIDLIMDMIVNHSGLHHWWLRDPPTPDWFNGTADAHTQTSHVHEANVDLYASEYDRRAFTDGWFVSAMPDLNQRNPLLARYLIQNALWWIEYLGLSGIRMDTYPYPDKHFMAEWNRRVLAEYPHFNIVGEEWQVDPAFVAYWQAGRAGAEAADGYAPHLPSLMDFPLQKALVDALTSDEADSLRGLYRTLASDIVYPHPERLVTFPDNHDMSRIFTQLGEDYSLYKMALAYILTMRGTPQIYYGTEILMHNRGTDSHGVIRSDFPGGWAGDSVNGFTGAGLSARAKEAQRWLRKLLHWRRGSEVIYRGKLVHFVPQDGVYVYFRYLEEEDKRVMVAFNKTRRRVRVPAARFAEQLRGTAHGTEVQSGQRFSLAPHITLPARGVVIVEIADE